MCSYLELLIQSFVALGTIGAVVVALFRDNLRIKFAPPELSVSLKDRSGHKTRVQLSWIEEGERKTRDELGRYYHLVVENKRRWSTAHQVQVFLTRIRSPGPDGEFQVIWHGEIPLKSRYQESYPLLRTLGPKAEFDLFSVTKNKALRIAPLFLPNDFPPPWKSSAHLELTIEARSIEYDTKPMQIQVDWDGDWNDGETEMARHLKVKQLLADAT